MTKKIFIIFLSFLLNFSNITGLFGIDKSKDKSKETAKPETQKPSINNNNNNNNNNNTKTFDDTIFDWSGTFAEVLRIAGEKHYSARKPEKAMIKAIDAFLNNLDPHSSFLDPKTYKSIVETTQGEFFGIGIVMDNTRSPKDKFLTVISTVPMGPSEKAGILAFDKIIEIDDIKLDGMTNEEATAKLKGPKNTKVKLKILRENKKEPLIFEITRGVVKAKTSFAFYIKDYDIYYICLTTFSNNAFKQIKEILEKSAKKPYKGLIIDLRNNSGGLLTSVVDICGLFLEKNSLVVITKDKYGVKKEEQRTKQDPIANPNIPIFILTNNYTASASEILAGCLKIHSQNMSKTPSATGTPKTPDLSKTNNTPKTPDLSKNTGTTKTPDISKTLSPDTQKTNNTPKAPAQKENKLLTFIVGTKSFGKGSVQEIIPISNDCAVKLTVCLYFLPDDSTIQGKGIEPDFLVEKLFPAPEKITWFLNHYGREKSLKHSIDPHKLDQNAGEKQDKTKPDGSNTTPAKSGSSQSSTSTSATGPTREKPAPLDKNSTKKDENNNKSDNKDNDQKSWSEKMKEILLADNQFIEALKLVNIFNVAKEKYPEKIQDRDSAIKFIREISALDGKINMEEVKTE